MTALAGLISTAGRDHRTDTQRMLRAQHIFGQTEAVWSCEWASLGRRIYQLLPEDRFDLAPQVSGGDTLALVADVRLDNREEIAAALGIERPRLDQMCDAALALHAFQRWDTGSFAKLVGDFAIVVWEAQQRRLIMARDFLGQRPLHYASGPGFFAFASMPVGIHALADVPIRVSQEAVENFVALLPEASSSTFFEGVSKVDPGHFLVIRNGELSSTRFWEHPEPRLDLSDTDYEDALRAEFDRAVGARLRRADGRMGCHLSAGLDSSAVTATAARLIGPNGRLTAYTSVPRPGFDKQFRNSIADEGPLASEVAKLYSNIDHVLVPASGHSPFDGLDRYYFLFGRPFLNLCNGVWMTEIMDRAMGSGVRVLLTGQAGNMTISYDGMAGLSEMLSGGRIQSLVSNAWSLWRKGTRAGTIAAQVFGPHVPAVCWRMIERARGKGRSLTDYTAINPERETVIRNRARARGLDPSYRPRSNATELRTWVLGRGDPGNFNKGMLGGWGIDMRDPTADRRLVELCLSIPPEQFMAGGIPRSLARRAFSDRLPACVVGERRKGYQAADWYEALTRSRDQLAGELDRSKAQELNRSILDTTKMDSLMRDWPEGGWQSDTQIERYRLALLRGVSAAHFVRKASGSNL